MDELTRGCFPEESSLFSAEGTSGFFNPCRTSITSKPMDGVARTKLVFVDTALDFPQTRSESTLLATTAYAEVFGGDSKGARREPAQHIFLVVKAWMGRKRYTAK